MFSDFITVLGGLALFLFGVEACCQSFRQIGGWLHNTLFKMTQGHVKPFFFGTLLTLIAQNSTVATSLAIGFVDIGMMSLTGAILAMSGASFGGGLVILLISLNFVRFGPLLLFISLLLIRVSKKPEVQNYGRVLQGISLILLGMLMIQMGVAPLVRTSQLQALILWSSRNFFLMGFVAFVLTSIIQNNTAVIAIAISIASAGLISDTSGMAIVLGAHVGSTTIILLSGLGGKLNARRLGLATVVYKLLGALLVLPFTPLIIESVHRAGFSIAASLVAFQVILATLNALLVTPFSVLLKKGCEYIFPSIGNPGEPAYLSKDLLGVPAIALTLLSKELTRLANFVEAYLQIMFAIPNEQWRLFRLRANLKELSNECHVFFSSIPLPQNEPQLRRRYINLSMALSSLEDIITCIDRELTPIWTPLFLKNAALSNLMDEVLTIVRLAFRSFVLGDEGIEKTTKAQIALFSISENRLRYALAYDQTEENDSGGAIWELLAVFVKIVHCSERMLENVKLANPTGIVEEQAE